MVLAASFVIVVAGIRAAAVVLVPFLLALFLAVVVMPLYVGMQRRGIPSGVALLVLILALIGIGGVSVLVIGKSLTGFACELPVYQERLQEEVLGLSVWLEAHGVEAPERLLLDVLNPSAAMRVLGNTVSALSNLIGSSFIILLIAVFLLLEAALLPVKIRGIAGLNSDAIGRMQFMVENVRRYVGLKTVTSLLTGALIFIVLLVIGVSDALLLGLLAFILNYVPNIGSLIAAIPGILLALIQLGPGRAIGVAVAYIAINVLVSNGIEPRLMGRGLGLSPMIIVVTMLFWAWVLGPLGMLLAVPLTMVVKVALQSADETRWIATLMGTGSPADDGLAAKKA